MFSGGHTAEDDTTTTTNTSIVENNEKRSSSSSAIAATITENDDDDDDDENWMQRFRSSSSLQWTHSVDLTREDTYALLWQICTHRGFIVPDSTDMDTAIAGEAATIDDAVNVFSKSSMSEKDRGDMRRTMEILISRAAYRNWTTRHFDHVVRSVLLAEEKADDHDGNSAQIEAVCSGASHFWHRHRDDVHETRIADSCFSVHHRGAQLDRGAGIKWRIDQLTNANNISEISNTVALVELQQDSNSGKIVFEMDKAALESVLGTLRQIENRIDALSV